MPGSQILHSKTRRVKLNSARIVNSKLANGKKIVNYMRSNKNIRKTERTMGTRIAHGGDRKTSAIADHNGGRTRGRGRSDRGKYTSVGRGVIGSARVGDAVSADRRRQPHGAQRLHQ